MYSNQNISHYNYSKLQILRIYNYILLRAPTYLICSTKSMLHQRQFLIVKQTALYKCKVQRKVEKVNIHNYVHTTFTLLPENKIQHNAIQKEKIN